MQMKLFHVVMNTELKVLIVQVRELRPTESHRKQRPMPCHILPPLLWYVVTVATPRSTGKGAQLHRDAWC